MNEVKIQVGDLVRLRSGGPTMTVNYVNKEEFSCVYFRHGSSYQSYIFGEGALKRVQEETE